MREIMKPTEWHELDWEGAIILEQDNTTLKIAHPDLKRPRYFNLSQNGRYYSRFTGKESDYRAKGYIFPYLEA